MSRNPYAQPPFGAPQPQGFPSYDAEPRTSALAVSSLVFGLLCCIPGVGLIATILGGASLVRISSSGGRLSGRGMAFAGLILGLIGTFAWVALGVGLTQFLGQAGKLATTISTLQSPDRTTARSVLTASASAALSDEQLAAFNTQVNDALGSYVRTPKGVAEWLRDYQRTAEYPNSPIAPGGQVDDAIPVPVHFDKGVALVLLHADPSGAWGQFRNISIHDASGNTIWLIPPPGSTPPAAPRGGAAPSTPETPAPATPPADQEAEQPDADEPAQPASTPK